MRPQALLGQMMWYAIYIIRDTCRSYQEKLNAAKTTSISGHRNGNFKIQGTDYQDIPFVGGTFHLDAAL